MELVDHTVAWAKGEIFQGRIMFLYGLLLFISFAFIWRSNHEVLRGTMIPLGIVICVMLGYGGYLMASRPSIPSKVGHAFSINPYQTAQDELTRLQADHKTYSALKPIWVTLIVVSAILYLLVSGLYWKGLSIGFMALFISGLVTDTCLHYRLSKYMDSVQSALSLIN